MEEPAVLCFHPKVANGSLTTQGSSHDWPAANAHVSHPEPPLTIAAPYGMSPGPKKGELDNYGRPRLYGGFDAAVINTGDLGLEMKPITSWKPVVPDLLADTAVPLFPVVSYGDGLTSNSRKMFGEQPPMQGCSKKPKISSSEANRGTRRTYDEISKTGLSRHFVAKQWANNAWFHETSKKENYGSQEQDPVRFYQGTSNPNLSKPHSSQNACLEILKPDVSRHSGARQERRKDSHDVNRPQARGNSSWQGKIAPELITKAAPGSNYGHFAPQSGCSTVGTGAGGPSCIVQEVPQPSEVEKSVCREMISCWAPQTLRVTYPAEARHANPVGSVKQAENCGYDTLMLPAHCLSLDSQQSKPQGLISNLDGRQRLLGQTLPGELSVPAARPLHHSIEIGPHTEFQKRFGPDVGVVRRRNGNHPREETGSEVIRGKGQRASSHGAMKRSSGQNPATPAKRPPVAAPAKRPPVAAPATRKTSDDNRGRNTEIKKRNEVKAAGISKSRTVKDSHEKRADECDGNGASAHANIVEHVAETEDQIASCSSLRSTDSRAVRSQCGGQLLKPEQMGCRDSFIASPAMKRQAGNGTESFNGDRLLNKSAGLGSAPEKTLRTRAWDALGTEGRFLSAGESFVRCVGNFSGESPMWDVDRKEGSPQVQGHLPRAAAGTIPPTFEESLGKDNILPYRAGCREEDVVSSQPSGGESGKRAVVRRADTTSQETNDKETRCTKTPTCDLCGKTFTRHTTLACHRRIHAGLRPYACAQCGNTFRHPGNLSRHMLTHASVKKHACSYCDKRFNRPARLKAHERIHTDPKRHACEVCGKSFRQKIDLTVHRYTHTGEKPHACPKCGKRFKQATHLRYHLRIHSHVRMYKCEQCGKGFNQKGNLKAHLYHHTGARPHKCDVCGKAFPLASTLNTHKRTHAPFKPFSCEFCGRAYYQKYSLTAHYISSHPVLSGYCK